MKIKFKFKKLIRNIFILIVLIYIGYIFFCQQKTLNSYANGQEFYASQIEKEKQEQEALATLKENINSPEYIEQMAREKLDMYLPNERVYIDIEQ